MGLRISYSDPEEQSLSEIADGELFRVEDNEGGGCYLVVSTPSRTCGYLRTDKIEGENLVACINLDDGELIFLNNEIVVKPLHQESNMRVGLKGD